MDIRGILLDFDGTALQQDQTYISYRNKAALQAAMELGVEVIPTTGRVEDMFPPQIEADPRIRYWVTANGARVVDRKTKEIIYQSLFTPEESAALCQLFEGQGIYAEISANGSIYMEETVCDHLSDYPVPPHHVWFLEAGRQLPLDKPSAFFLRSGIGIEKVNLYGVPKEKQQPILDALEAMGEASVTDGAGTDIQFFPKRLDRANALDALFERLGLSYEQVMALGDSALDAPIIQRSGVGVAMGNAPDWVKEQADFVTAPYHEDGVALAIERYILKPQAGR